MDKSSIGAKGIVSEIGRRLGVLLPAILVVVVAAGCASTKVSDRKVLVTEKLPRPDTIWVYNFAATPADLPADSELAREYAQDGGPQSAEDAALGRRLGSQIATELVQELNAMGMRAKVATAGSKPAIDDLILRGYLVSFEEGSAKKRVAIGLRSGSSELRVAAEGFQVTSQGLRKLGSGTTDAAGAKTPGSAVGAATWLATSNPAGFIVSTGMRVYGEKSGKSKIEGRAEATAKEIADLLRKRFQDQGWVK